MGGGQCKSYEPLDPPLSNADSHTIQYDTIRYDTDAQKQREVK